MLASSACEELLGGERPPHGLGEPTWQSPCSVSLQKNTRVYPCMWCKTLCKNFDMLSHQDRKGKTSLFCSICCTTSYKVKQAGLTGQEWKERWGFGPPCATEG